MTKSRFAPRQTVEAPLVLEAPKKMGEVREINIYPDPQKEKIDFDERKTQMGNRMQKQLQPFHQYFDSPSLVDRINSLEPRNNLKRRNEFNVEYQPFLDQHARVLLKNRIKLFNKLGSGIDESHPSMTIDEYKTRKAQQLESKLRAIERKANERFDDKLYDPNLYERPLYRMFTGTDEGIQSAQQINNGPPLPPEKKRLYEKMHMQANVKAAKDGEDTYYSPFLSTAGSLSNYLNTDLDPTRGDNNLLNTVFSLAPRLGAFAVPKNAAVPARNNKDASKFSSLAEREDEVVVDTDNYNLPDGKLYQDNEDAQHNFANPFYDNLQMNYPYSISNKAIEQKHLSPNNKKAQSLAEYLGVPTHQQSNLVSDDYADPEEKYNPGRSRYIDFNTKLIDASSKIKQHKTASPLEPFESGVPITKSHQYNLEKYTEGAKLLEDLLTDIPTVRRTRNIDLLGWDVKNPRIENNIMNKYNQEEFKRRTHSRQAHSRQLSENLRNHYNLQRRFPID